MLKYTYYDFINRFDEIYNSTSSEYHKRACYWMYIICNEYTKVKKSSDLPLRKIIDHLIMEGRKTYRLNNKVFHLNYIGFILYWKYYKLSFNDLNTVVQYNSILTGLKLPDNLTEGFPVLLQTFDNSFKPIIDKVIEANKAYYERKNQSEIELLDKQFRNELKQRFNEQMSYITRLRDELVELPFGVYTTLFVDYYSACDIAIVNEIMYDLLKNDYRKLSKKYPLVDVDYKTNSITKMVFNDFSYFVKIGLDSKHDKEGVAKAVIESYEKLCLMNYSYPKYKFDSIEHRDLILSLIN